MILSPKTENEPLKGIGPSKLDWISTPVMGAKVFGCIVVDGVVMSFEIFDWGESFAAFVASRWAGVIFLVLANVN